MADSPTDKSRRGQPWRALRDLARAARTRAEPARKPIVVLTWTILVGTIAFDVVLLVTEPPGNTFSEVMREAARRYPVLPWVLGLLLAHLFHNRDDRPPVIDRVEGATLTLLITLFALAWGFVGVSLPVWSLGTLAVAGLVAGHLLWPIERPAGWRW